MQLLLPMLNSAAETWRSFFYHVGWQASLLAMLLLVVVVVLGRRWPSPLRYWLLVLALVKFALPPLLSLPTGVFSQVGPAVQAAPAVVNRPPVAWTDRANMDLTPLRGAGPAERVQIGPTPLPMPAAESYVASPGLDPWVWLMLAHVLGAFVAACLTLRSLLAVRRAICRGREVTDGELQRRFVRLSDRLGLRRRPRLLLTSEPFGPAACGVLRPVVVLPQEVVSLDASALDVILAHELAHHRRGDLWVNWVQLALSAVWWFNPVLWVLNRQIRKLREDCCDDLLLTRNIATDQAYCDTLLSAASKLAGRATVGVSLGFGDHLHPLGRRFERIMDRTLRRAPRLSFRGILFLTVLAGLVLPGLRRLDGEEQTAAEGPSEPARKDVANASDAEPAARVVWPAGATVHGRVLDHLGAPVANAEVLMLGEERIIVDADRRTWFVPEKEAPSPPSTRTDQDGAFAITRKQGTADRLAVIAEDPLFWVVSGDRLARQDNVDIQLPAAGSLAVGCDLPGKSPKQPVMIELQSFDGVVWNRDFLRFHMSTFTLDNPGETLFERLPPGHYAVQRNQETKTSGNSVLLTGADRELVKIEAAQRSSIRFERTIGRPLSGQVRGLENAELREAHLTISYPGPEEVLLRDGKLGRRYVAFDVIPITSEGHFTTDPIPPGKYFVSLYAVLASTPQRSSQSSDFSAEQSFTAPEDGDPPKVEIVAKARDPRDLSKVTDLRLRVVDEQGEPLSKFEAMVHTADQGYGFWSEGRDGTVFLGANSEYRGADLEVLVRADGYAPTIARFAVEQREKLSKGEAEVTLRRGQQVQLQFNLPSEMTWPTGVLPEAYFDDLQERVRMMRQPSNRRSDSVLDFNMLNVREVGAGRFEFWLAKDTPRFHVAVHAPGFLQNFETGPFTLADVTEGKLEIDIPRPATLEVSFAPGDHLGANAPFKGVAIDLYWRLPGNSALSVASVSGSSLTPNLRMTDLAPGDYLVNVRTQPKEDNKPIPGAGINEGAYYDRRTPTLEAGQTERIDFRSKPFNPDAFRGTRTAVVRIRNPDGSPAKDRQATVTYFDGHFGAHVVFSGAASASGEIVLTDITDAPLPPWYPYAAYTVSVDEKRLGAFGFTDQAPKPEFEFVLAPGEGDMAPDVELTSLATGKAVRLSDLRGKVVFLEFWATWCGPCQQPMAKLNALGTEQGAAWKDRVAIVPVNIDSERARAESHAQRRGWTALEHFWSGGPKGGDFEAPAARAFVVNGVPEAVLIGADGRILWRGHPQDGSDGKDTKSRILDALK